jgi:outer membrane protein TolC
LEEQRRILAEEAFLGLALGVDLASADINLAEARLNIASLELDLAEMERQFAELLGLETLPLLSERVDINRTIALPSAAATGALARERNPDLIEARFSITKKQAELKYITHSWIPSFRLAGNFGLTGQQYPLTRYNWSVGINVEFSSPWFQNRIGTQMGWEPALPSQGLFDRTAMVQNSFTPLPDPAASYGRRQAELALSLERENYALVFERIGRVAENAVRKCALAEQKRVLAIQAASLGRERCRIEEIRLELGQITRITLMEAMIEQTQKEIAMVEAAIALLEAERELENFLDLKPGELSTFASTVQTRGTL